MKGCKRIVIIYRINKSEDTTTGIFNKLLQQKNAFIELGFETDIIYYGDFGIFLNNQKIISFRNSNKRLRQLEILLMFYKNVYKLINREYDIIYLRYSPLSVGLISFLKRLKSSHSNSKIYLDLPTFPFIQEYSTWKRFLVKRISSRQQKLAPFVHAITTVEKSRQIWGIETINISNGIGVESYPLNRSIKKNGRIRFIYVGHLVPAIGLDLFLEGIMEYRGSYSIELKIIGDGPSKEEWLAISKKIPKKHSVVFIKSSFGKALDDHFDESDIGVGVLGMHRIDFNYSSSLKHREYSSRGTPFIYASEDIDFHDAKFAYKIDSVEKPSNLQDIIEYFEQNEVSPQIIRKFAKLNLDWKVQLQPILDHFS